MKTSYRRIAALGLALVLACGTAIAAPSGLFAVYENNRAQGISNYITADLVLLAYGLVRDETLTQAEQNQWLPRLQALFQGLRESPQSDDAIGKANQDYLAVLEALAQGAEQPVKPADSERAGAEFKRVLDAKGPAPSPLWGMVIDYSQFQPRGHYARSPALERYFRAYRYAGSVLFAIQDSRATGVTPEQANRMAGQAVRLVQALQTPAVKTTYAQLNDALEWAFGPGDDLRTEDLLAIAQEQTDLTALRQALRELARQQDRQPRILGGIVDRSKLEPNLTPQDVLIGWRLLPLRYSPESAIFQRLVYDSVGVYKNDCPTCPAPFSLAVIDGKKVKGFPSAFELMALLGSEPARQCLDHHRETRYEGYDAAFETAARELDRAEGLNAVEMQLIQAGFQDRSTDVEPAQRLTSMLGFWTWRRYLSLLYSKQSYTVGAKNLVSPRERAGAWLEPASGIYLTLAHAVAQHRANAPHPTWDRFAAVLDRLVAISARELRSMPPNASDIAFLNALDRTLQELAGVTDSPIVVDVHTLPASGEVLEQAVGYARVVQKMLKDGQQARGARFTHYEFKQPLMERLTDEGWRELLAKTIAEGQGLPRFNPCVPAQVEQQTTADSDKTAEAQAGTVPPKAEGADSSMAMLGSSGTGSSPLAVPPLDPKPTPRNRAEEKLDALLMGLVQAQADGGAPAVRRFIQAKGLALREDKIKVQVVAASMADTSILKSEIKAMGGTLIVALQNQLFVWLPPAAVGELAALNTVWTMSVPQALSVPQAEQSPTMGGEVTVPARDH